MSTNLLNTMVSQKYYLRSKVKTILDEKGISETTQAEHINTPNEPASPRTYYNFNVRLINFTYKFWLIFN